MKKRNKRLYLIVAFFVTTYLLFKFSQSYSTSLFSFKGDRINIVMYGEKTAYYSLDKKDTRHYLMYFYPDLKMTVPGGYGEYKVGSIGKLAKLDKNPDLLRKTFAIATTSFVNIYFYPNTEDVYNGTQFDKKPVKPSIQSILMMPGNASILDRIYLSFVVLDKDDNDFHLIAYQSEKENVHNDVFFEDASFIKNSIGLLFQQRYRNEQKNIQLQYKSEYSVAEKISSLLEGNGIRVNDITLDMNKRNKCNIVENSENYSETAIDLAAYFGCELSVGKTDVYDIVFVLANLEKEWEI